MALHRLASITIGVPNVEETSAYYEEFGLLRDGAVFSTSDGGEQLRIVESPSRRLIELCIGVDDPDDLGRAAERLTGLGVTLQRDPAILSAIEIHSGTRVAMKVLPRISSIRPCRSRTTSPAVPSDRTLVHRAYSAKYRSAPVNWVTSSSARLTAKPRNASSSMASGSR